MKSRLRKVKGKSVAPLGSNLVAEAVCTVNLHYMEFWHARPSFASQPLAHVEMHWSRKVLSTKQAPPTQRTGGEKVINDHQPAHI